MNRRVLLKNILVSTGGMVVLPVWARKWSIERVGLEAGYLSLFESGLLSSIVDTIIPTTDTPGARDLGVDKLIEKILLDCYEKSVQESFKQGLLQVEELSKKKLGVAFLELNTDQRLVVLKEMEAKNAAALQQHGDANSVQQRPAGQGNRVVPFFSLLKDLTILGYTNSEYVMTNLTGYVAVPGHYYGCVTTASKNLHKQ